jgi:ABC-type transport system involved in cytochrome c biogenesis permease subunit
MGGLRKILSPLASLRLTVVLLAASMFLVLAGTVAQIDHDIWQVQKTIFHSWWTWVSFQSFLPRPQPGHDPIPGGIPFVGGYTLIVLLLVNLLSAHATRFRFTWKRSGVMLIHFGLVLLLVGELLTSRLAHEGQMVLTEGDTLNFTNDTHLMELAIVNRTPADHDAVTVIPGSRLSPGETIHDPQLPFDVRIDDFWPNSTILGPMQSDPDAIAAATAGAGAQLKVKGIPVFSGAGDDAEKENMPSAFVTFFKGDKELGTYLVSEFFDGPQEVKVDGSSYWVQLRPRRYYKPYTVTLIHFSHDNYIGSDTAKNFSSLVRVVDPAQGVDRTVNIWMNHPLRFDGDVFYQQSFLPGDKTSILQVVKNPGWTLPYIACAIGALGLLIHFGITLITFLRRRSAENAEKARQEALAYPQPRQSAGYTLAARSMFSPATAFAAAVIVIALAYLSYQQFDAMRTPEDPKAFNYALFGHIPVTYDGRTMPLDSLARNSLRIISNIEEVHNDDGTTASADQWLASLMVHDDQTRQLPVFRIDHPDLVNLLGLDPHKSRFTFNQIIAHVDDLHKQFEQIEKVPDHARDAYQQKMAELWGHLTLFANLVQWQGNASIQWEGLYVIAPLQPGEKWQTPFQLTHGFTTPARDNASAIWFDAMMQHLRDNDPAGFNSDVNQYLSLLRRDMPKTMRGVDYEVFFNHFEPFYLCMILYVSVFVLAALSWLIWPGLGRAAISLLVLTLLVHSFGLASRAYISGRLPPVTNLYSSAIFIGWGAVVLAGALELLYRNGIGSAIAAAVGFVTLFIAHHLAINPALSPTGDTMEMMRAVLDTNLWLGTHVVCITLGYATTFLTGAFACVFVIGGVFTPGIDAEQRKSLSRMIYGTICFAMFFSFVGTILGGIWADQSWGRFWGWDPKENGAVLIVLWNALILHARWAGIARQRGVALLAIFGNIVTSWSWFGTNMLGVGLHSYGFMAAAFWWLFAFMASQLLLIAIGLIPQRYWRSYQSEKPPPLAAQVR